MELHFQNPGFDYMLEQILAFQDEDASPFWSAPLYRFYPQLEPARTLPRPARLEAIARELRSVYAFIQNGGVAPQPLPGAGLPQTPAPSKSTGKDLESS